MDLTDPDALTATILKEQLRSRGVTGLSSMRKPELVERFKQMVKQDIDKINTVAATSAKTSAAAEAAAATAAAANDDSDDDQASETRPAIENEDDFTMPEPDKDLPPIINVPVNLLDLVRASDLELALWQAHPLHRSGELHRFATEMDGPAATKGGTYPALSVFAHDVLATPQQSQYVEGTFNVLDHVRGKRTALAPQRAAAQVRFRYNTLFAAKNATAKRGFSVR